MTASSDREVILGDVKRALHREGKPGPVLGPSTSRGLDQLVSEIKKKCEARRADLIQRFEFELTRIGGRFHRATSLESARQYIEQVASDRQAGILVASEAQVIDDIDLKARLEKKGIEVLTETTGGEFLATAAVAGIGVSGVDYGLADTGTLVLLARKGQARSISLLPPVHIAVMKPEQVISGLSDLFPLLRAEAEGEGRGLSSAITFITGPSRTADIELTLVVGVHGPQQLHLVLLEN